MIFAVCARTIMNQFCISPYESRSRLLTRPNAADIFKFRIPLHWILYFCFIFIVILANSWRPVSFESLQCLSVVRFDFTSVCTMSRYSRTHYFVNEDIYGKIIKAPERKSPPEKILQQPSRLSPPESEYATIYEATHGIGTYLHITTTVLKFESIHFYPFYVMGLYNLPNFI